jgi:hypothetical protein
VPWLSTPAPRRLIFGTFFAVTIPLALLIGSGRAQAQPLVLELYALTLSLTHFALTFLVYCSGANRRHFVSTPKNLAIFLVAPLGAFTFLALWFGLALDARFVGGALAVGMIIRALDFLHLSRQSFGVLQLFKAGTVARWVMRAENAYLLALAALTFVTYLTNLRFEASSPVAWSGAFIVLVLLAIVLVGYAQALRSSANRRQVLVALGYLAIQSVASLLAVWRLEFYLCALAVHYVEYHVIMGRRVFGGPLEPGDRLLAAVRRTPALLYLGLFAVSALVMAVTRLQPELHDGPAGPRLLVHLFDGLFVFHYLLEMSIWKFRDPYFRSTIGPLFA